jgi:hypothetical protein
MGQLTGLQIQRAMVMTTIRIDSYQVRAKVKCNNVINIYMYGNGFFKSFSFSKNLKMNESGCR